MRPRLAVAALAVVAIVLALVAYSQLDGDVAPPSGYGVGPPVQ